MRCRMLRRMIVMILLVSGGAVSAQARSIPAVEGLEALRKGFAGISDFSAEITQEKRLKLMKRSLVMTGTVRFRKPDQFIMEINPPYASRMTLRDTVMEQTSGRDGEKNRIVLPPEQGLKQWFSKLTSPVTAQPEGVAIQADLTNGIYTLGITPQGKSQIKELAITFQEDGTIRRLIITEQNGDRAAMTFKKVRRNTGLTEKDFRLD
ncbi:MAG: outer membrane lipoprotein carrier protein LolA [Desulfuromonadales bacterium]|nr:outer membrane lipoprotein carrier protein LolA [Desulfuromonadales bacterium]